MGKQDSRSSTSTTRVAIRDAALKLFSVSGESGTSMRDIAAEAGVTVGLLVHYYGTKASLRAAVNERVVELFADTIVATPVAATARETASSRDAAVSEMLSKNPEIIDYLRHAILSNHQTPNELVEKLADLAAQQIEVLRASGLVSLDRNTSDQVASILMRQLGALFLQPLLDHIYGHFGEDSGAELVVTIRR